MNKKGQFGWILFVIVLLLAVSGIFYSIGSSRVKETFVEIPKIEYQNITCEDYKDLIINQDTSYITNAIANTSQKAYKNGYDSKS